MKNLSLKMDDSIFSETEKIVSKINKNRNRYINEAVEFYNLLQKENISQTASEGIKARPGGINESISRI